MSKNKNDDLIKSKNDDVVILNKNNNLLYAEISHRIELSRRTIFTQASSATVLLFWEIGRLINHNILDNKRADYGKQIIVTLSRELTEKYGRSFDEKNLRRMMQFAEQFSDEENVVTLSRHLSWSHFLALIPLKSNEAKMYYAQEVMKGCLGVRALRKIISRKAYERREIADAQISIESQIPLGTFKDPYLFDILGIKDEYLEDDLEDAILRELEKFILEFGKGFAFVERQKRMIIDGRDNKLDLLLFNRYLRRLVAVELKIGRFEASHKGQMELYLAWLDKYERCEGEEAPIGIILCTESGREEIEFLKLARDGIMVAEYWTTLPPKAEFENKIQTILEETRERMAQRNLLIEKEE
ncbi:MAG: PDDEXK nuclease domain-containing protein [Defluviitaleaceae bacterium]|nr:PDDEXK nuclease domain-containing protein [Defluviitaleaceae bacterium]